MAGRRVSAIKKWEWENEPPDAETVVVSLESLPTVWGVETVRYAEHVLPMSQEQTIHLDADGNRTSKSRSSRSQKVQVWKLYMQVAGRLMMLNSAQEAHGWQVNFIPAEAHHVTDVGTIVPMPAFRGGDTIVYREVIEILTPRYQVTDQMLDASGGTQAVTERRTGDFVLLGRRPGMAALKAGGFVPPWEKVETAARGRALGAWGFGVLPGSGIASLDEMQMAGPDYLPDADEVERTADLNPEDVERNLRTAIEQLRVVRDRTPEEVAKMVQGYALQISGKEVPIVDGVVDLSSLPVQQLELLRRRVAALLREVRDLSG